MSASKKRRRLPDEDLAAAVADIINSPITRSNLSFLRQSPFPASEPNTKADSLKHEHSNNSLEQKPGGLNSEPPGFSFPTIHEAVETLESEIPSEFTTLEPASIYPETSTTDILSVDSKPVGVESIPHGFEVTPSGFESSPGGVGLSSIGGFYDGNSIQPISSQEKHRWEPQSTNRPLWQAEGLATLFEQSRVKRIRQAQDALSLVEEKVYDLLWGTKNQQKDEFRLVHYSLQRVANDARVNIKTVRELIPRLIDKGFIKIEYGADVRRNIPTLYRVFSYSSILQHQRQRNRFYVVKTGKGVFYVHPVAASLYSRENDFEAHTKPGGLDSFPAGFKPLGIEELPPGFQPTPNGLKNMAPLGDSSPKPTGASGPLSIDNLEDKIIRQTSTSLWSKLFATIRDSLRIDADNQLLRVMVISCHRNAMDTTGDLATEDEIVYFTTTKASVLARTPNIRNHLAVLRKAVPECFLGETFRAYRQATKTQQEKQGHEETEKQTERENLERSARAEQARHALWSAISERYRSELGYDMEGIVNDPDLDEIGKQQARGMLQRLGRYTRIGI